MHALAVGRHSRLAARILARNLASKAPKAPLISTSLDESSGVLEFTLDNEKKLNALTLPMLSMLTDTLGSAASDEKVKGIVVTGRGKYYSAGVDLSSTIQMMAPSRLVSRIQEQNQTLFDTIINFPKPIVAAVNGPAIGASVTSATLMDAIVASEGASFSLPFAKLGVPPEGCSSVTWEEFMGAEKAARMLGPENWTPTAQEAQSAGLISEVVPGGSAELVARAKELVEERIRAGGGRRFDEAEKQRLLAVNAEESAQLANAFVSSKFLSAMYKFNLEKKKTKVAYFFLAANTLLPLWQPAPVAVKHA